MHRFLGPATAHRGFFENGMAPAGGGTSPPPTFAAAAKTASGIEAGCTVYRGPAACGFSTMIRYGSANDPRPGFVHDMPWEEFSARPLTGSDEHPPVCRMHAPSPRPTPTYAADRRDQEPQQYKHNTYLEGAFTAQQCRAENHGPYCIERLRPPSPRGQQPTATGATARPVHIPCRVRVLPLPGQLSGATDFIARCPAPQLGRAPLRAPQGLST